MSAGIDSTRRALLFGRPRAPAPLRPPWAQEEDAFTAACTQCERCIDACETGILVRGDGGYPEVDFSRGECTFCAACAQTCPEPAFRDTSQSPWDNVASIAETCFAPQGIYCRSCGESCEAAAIHFSYNAYRVPEPTVDADACTGCGACVQVCPADAVRVSGNEVKDAR